MRQASQLRNNTYFEYESNPFRVLKYKHTHLGRGGANIRVKAKNLTNGNIRNFNFGANEKFDEVILEKRIMQYLYADEENYYFMDPATYEQTEIGKKNIGERGKYFKDGEEATVLLWQGTPFDI